MAKKIAEYDDAKIYRVKVGKVVTVSREKIRPGMIANIKGRIINGDDALKDAIVEAFPVE